MWFSNALRVQLGHTKKRCKDVSHYLPTSERSDSRTKYKIDFGIEDRARWNNCKVRVSGSGGGLPGAGCWWGLPHGSSVFHQLLHQDRWIPIQSIPFHRSNEQRDFLNIVLKKLFFWLSECSAPGGPRRRLWIIYLLSASLI